MSQLHMVRSAYGATPLKSARRTEYDAFARVTHALRQASEADPPSFSRLAEAVHQNRRLWIVLATDLAGEGNALPQALRARLFYLAQFTIEQSRRILDGRGDCGVLIDINTAVMRGLRAEGDPA